MNRQIKTIIISLLICLIFSGCQGSVSQNSIDKVVDDIKSEAVKKLKKAFVKEVEEFLATDDLSAALGISSDDRKKIQNSIRGYVDNYEFDEEALKEAKASVEGILKNAEGLSVEEIEKKIKQVFEK